MIFISFPAWQMPFGGHQQICKSFILSHLPFFHLLPTKLYRFILKLFNESDACVRELMSIKQTQCSIETFEKEVCNAQLTITNRTFYFINPHYETKFNLRPRLLNTHLSHIPYIRNYFTTSCFYILS